MRILLIHYRYFIVGGPEKYMFNIIKKLEGEGHEVIPFSVRSNKNIESRYSKYFVEPICDADSVYYSEYKKTPKVIMQLLSRSFYAYDVKKAVKRIIKDTNPDVVYVMCYLNKLSPSVITAAKEMGKRVVVRLSEYGLMCPTSLFLYKNNVCEDCVTKGYGVCLKKKCVKNSFPASLVRVASMKFHEIMHIYDNVDAFITPSSFLKEKLLTHKFKKKDIYHIPTFTYFDESKRPEIKLGDYGIYFGRISPEKGLEYVIKAYEKLGNEYKLKVVGDLESDEAERLRAYLKEKNITNVEFVGFKLGDDLNTLISGAKYVFLPSIWYDNFPNVVLESYMNGKAVIASNLGSLPEMVIDGKTGLLFEPKNVDDIINCIKKLENKEFLESLSGNAFNHLIQNYSADIHYNKLIQVLKGV